MRKNVETNGQRPIKGRVRLVLACRSFILNSSVYAMDPRDSM